MKEWQEWSVSPDFAELSDAKRGKHLLDKVAQLSAARKKFELDVASDVKRTEQRLTQTWRVVEAITVLEAENSTAQPGIPPDPAARRKLEGTPTCPVN